MIEREEETENPDPNDYKEEKRVPKRKSVEQKKENFILHSGLLDHIKRDKILPLVSFFIPTKSVQISTYLAANLHIY